MPSQEAWEGLKVHRPRFFYVPGLLKNLDAAFYARGLKRWLRRQADRFQPDLLDAHFIWPDGVGVARLARELGLPCVITLRGKIYPCAEIPSQRRQMTEALQQADEVISVSSDMARLGRELGADPERLTVIANGVDVQRFQPRDKMAARRKLGLPEEGRLVVMVGHVKKTKGQGEAIRAMQQLPKDVGLVMVGGDADGGVLRREMHPLVEELGERAIFAGRADYDLIPAYFNAADVSVLASHREGCPNVVLESLASGVPVVATRVGAVADLMADGRDGRIVPPDDVEALASALQDVLGRPWLAGEIASGPSVKSWDQVAEKVHEVFLRAVEADGRSEKAR
jgi:glycosyltransferase involved in cell wall biosynthesis